MLIQRAFRGAADVRMSVAGTLAIARQILADDRPHLAFVDAHLPDGRGVELLTDELACPTVIMTSQEHSRTAVEARQLGALDYVVKSPTVFRRLPEVAQSLLAQQMRADGGD